MTAPRFYKVTFGAEGRGGIQWSLPEGRPGDWHEIQGDLVPHRNAFHVTDKPRLYFFGGAYGRDVWTVEVAGEVVPVDPLRGDWCVRRFRFVRRVDASALPRRRPAGPRPMARRIPSPSGGRTRIARA